MFISNQLNRTLGALANEKVHQGFNRAPAPSVAWLSPRRFCSMKSPFTKSRLTAKSQESPMPQAQTNDLIRKENQEIKLNPEFQITQQMFEQLDWQHQHKNQLLSSALGEVSHSRYPAVAFKTLVKGSPEAMQRLLIADIENHQDWSDAVNKVSVISTPSPLEQLISIETKGKFGIGARFSLVTAIMQQTNNGTVQLLLRQLPITDSLYTTHNSQNKTLLAHFKTYIEFVPLHQTDSTKVNSSTVKSYEMRYYNHTDPNLRIPKSLFISESTQNHRAFVENCALNLLQS